MFTLMQEFASEDSQAALLHLQRHKLLLVIINSMADILFKCAIEQFSALVEFSLMAAGKAPQTSIIDTDILEGDPEAKEGIRIGVEIGGILMDIHLSTNLWWFENGH